MWSCSPKVTYSVLRSLPDNREVRGETFFSSVPLPHPQETPDGNWGKGDVFGDVYVTGEETLRENPKEFIVTGTSEHW